MCLLREFNELHRALDFEISIIIAVTGGFKND